MSKTKVFSLLFGVLLILLPGKPSIAQDTKVNGTVSDRQGLPLPGVSVSVSGTSQGTVTDDKGNYVLQIRGVKAPELVFSCLGYETVKIPVEGKLRVDAVLEESSEFLDDVVVVGYGTIRKSDMVGSSAAMKGDRIPDMKAYSFEQAMQGRLAGVVVSGTSGEPGSQINISVRGASSINGSNSPLYVIDGVPMDNIGTAAEYEGGSGFNVMSFLNPNDIESIEVLKDASSTAIYGSRGANGVIMVTTRQGGKGDAQVSLNVSHSISWSNRYFDLVGGEDYAKYVNEGYMNISGREPYPAIGGYYGDIYVPGWSEVGEGTNWQKEIRQTGQSGDYQMAISGGNGKTGYFISGGASLEEGIILRNDYDKYNLRANFWADAKPWLTAKFSAYAFMVDANRVNSVTQQTAYTNTGRNGVVFKALWANPMLALDHEAFKVDALTSSVDMGATGMVNPYLDAMNETYHKRTYNVNFNTDLVFKIFKDLTFTVRGNVLYYNDSNRRSWNEKTLNAWRMNGYYTDASSNTFKVGNENFFNYSNRFGGHSINAAAGVSFEKSSIKSLYYDLQDYSVSFKNYENKNAYANSVAYTSKPSVGASDRVLLSAYGRVNYSYKGRYLLNFTIRTDGASVFAAERKWAVFPSFGVGWNFTKENFMRWAGNVLTNGKIRYSYGASGNQAISPYGSLASLSSVVKTDSEGNTFMGFRVGSHPENPYLTWETTKQHDLGLDLAFFGRVTLGVDIYRKTTDNLLQSITIPAQTGYTSYVGNMGSIRNQGLEAELGVNAVNKRDFFWNINATFTTNRGKILDLGSQSLIDYNAPTYGANYVDPTHRLTVGGRIGDFFGLTTDGLRTAQDVENGYPAYRNGREEGRVKYVDVGEDGVISLDKDGKVIGNANPDFVAGFGSDIGFKGFTLSFMFNASVGNDILNLNKLFSEFGNVQVGVPTKDYMKDHWTPDNTDAKYPIAMNNSGMAICDRIVEDGSFLRLSTVTLRYDIPKFKFLKNFGASVYVTGTNLLLLTGYSGYDPELSAYGSNALRAGVDQGVYPRPKAVTFGIDLKF